MTRRTPKTGASASPALAYAKGPTKAEQRAQRLAEAPRPPLRRYRTQKRPLNRATAERRASASQKARITLLRKTEAKVRDFMRCIVPGCPVRGRHAIAGAHLTNSGMGGRFSVGCERKHFAAVCHEHHTGSKSLHTTHLMVKPLTEDLADGPLAWYSRERAGNVWGAYVLIGISRPLPPPVRS